MRRFADKVVMVTGAGSGIGKASAERIATEGGAVFCVDLNAEAVAATVAGIAEVGGEASSHVCNVGEESSVAACVSACVARYGSLYALVNMAGILRFDDTEQLQVADWQKVIDINLTGTMLLCRAVLPHLLRPKAVSSTPPRPLPYPACPAGWPIPPAKAVCWP